MSADWRKALSIKASLGCAVLWVLAITLCRQKPLISLYKMFNQTSGSAMLKLIAIRQLPTAQL
jgi:hypothetical protein